MIKKFYLQPLWKNGIYYLYPDYPNQKISKKVTFEASNAQMINWHHKFAHVSSDLIMNTYKHKCVRELPDLKKAGYFWEICRLNKQSRVSFKPTENPRVKRPLELLVLDVWGPVKDKGRGRWKIFFVYHWWIFKTSSSSSNSD